MMNSPPIRAGDWEIVDMKPLSSTILTLDGLDGEKAQLYELVIAGGIIGAGSSPIYMRLNGDAATSYLNHSIGLGSNGTPYNQSGTATYMALGPVMNEVRHFDARLLIHPLTGVKRKVFGDVMIWNVTSGLAQRFAMGATWGDTAATLASISIGVASPASFTSGNAILKQLRV